MKRSLDIQSILFYYLLEPQQLVAFYKDSLFANTKTAITFKMTRIMKTYFFIAIMIDETWDCVVLVIWQTNITFFHRQPVSSRCYKFQNVVKSNSVEGESWLQRRWTFERMGCGLSLTGKMADSSLDTLPVVTVDLSPVTSSCSIVSRTPSIVSGWSDAGTICPPNAEELAAIEELLGPNWRNRVRDRDIW